MNLHERSKDILIYRRGDIINDRDSGNFMLLPCVRITPGRPRASHLCDEWTVWLMLCRRDLAQLDGILWLKLLLGYWVTRGLISQSWILQKSLLGYCVIVGKYIRKVVLVWWICLAEGVIREMNEGFGKEGERWRQIKDTKREKESKENIEKADWER